MTITIHLPAELEAKLRARLDVRGVALSEFVRKAIADKLDRAPLIRIARDWERSLIQFRETSAMLTKTQIGRCGEMLVQYHLLRAGIESAPMTTDTGVDLVAYLPATKRPFTI